ncbi:MAG: NAD-binding protein, partial [Methanomicrobiaceae archaeon]|nr:NAD-binding protein [Methanomicrobiaceae archaeon]
MIELWEVIRSVLPDRTLRLYLLLLFGQIAFYTTLIHQSFPILEGRSLTWGEALLFVVETMSTVGYGDLLPFESQVTVGIVILVMATGVFTVLMIIPVLLTPYLTAVLRATPPTRIPRRLSGHIIIVGYNRLARAIIESLEVLDTPIVVVEKDEELARKARRDYPRQVFVVWAKNLGSAGTWTGAGVESASTVIINERERVAATVTLAIRERTGARIIAVIDDIAFDRYLRYAGAEYVLSPKNSAGKILARHAVLRPEIDTIYEAISMEQMQMDSSSAGTGLILAKAPIMEGSHAIGKTLGDLDLFSRFGVDVLFFWKAGEFVPSPKETDTVDPSTMLFLLGRADAIRQVLEEELAPAARGEEIAVIAGYGDVGKAAYRELSQKGIGCIVVDPKASGDHAVVGNAEQEEALKEARIESARFLVAAVNDDAVNIFTTLLARNLNPRLRILARANEELVTLRREAQVLTEKRSLWLGELSALAGTLQDWTEHKT